MIKFSDYRFLTFLTGCPLASLDLMGNLLTQVHREKNGHGSNLTTD